MLGILSSTVPKCTLSRRCLIYFEFMNIAINSFHGFLSWLDTSLTWAAVGAVLFILLLALVLYRRFSIQGLEPRLKAMNAAIAAVRTHILSKETPDFEDLKNLDNDLKNNDVVATPWQCFRPLLRKSLPGKNAATASWRSLEAPGRFFNADLLDQESVDIRRAMATPGFLLSLGLLFTFIGLVVALLSTSAAMIGGTGALNDNRAMDGLLMSASFKFITSAAGLFSAMVFRLYLRARLHQARNVAAELESTFATAFPVVQSGEMQFCQIEEIVRLGVKLDNHFNALDNRFESLQQAQQEIADKLREALKEFVAELKEVNTEALKQMAENFSKEIRTALVEHLENIGRQMVAASNKIQEASIALGETSKTMTEGLGKSTEHFQDTITNVTSRLSETIIKDLVPFSEMMKAAAETATTLSDKAVKSLEKITPVTEAMAKASGSITTTANEMKQAAGPLREGLVTLEGLGAQLKVFADAVQEQITKINDILGEQRTMQEQMVETMELHMNNLNQEHAELLEKSSRIADALARTAVLTAKLVEQLDIMADTVMKLPGQS